MNSKVVYIVFWIHCPSIGSIIMHEGCKNLVKNSKEFFRNDLDPYPIKVLKYNDSNSLSCCFVQFSLVLTTLVFSAFFALV